MKLDLGVGIAADVQHVGQKRKRQATQELSTSSQPPSSSQQANGAPQQPSSSVGSVSAKRKKTAPDESMFHPSLQAAIAEMKELIMKENWENKGKFPPALKPPLARLAVLAIRLDEYDDDFFSYMPVLFPYNKFTMTVRVHLFVFNNCGAYFTTIRNLSNAPCFPIINSCLWIDRISSSRSSSNSQMKGLREPKRSGKNRSLLGVGNLSLPFLDFLLISIFFTIFSDKRQEKTRNEQHEADGIASGSGGGTAPPTRHPTEEMDVDGHPPAAGKDKDGKDGAKDPNNHPPARRYRMTDQMKAIVWELVLLSNECCRLENEKKCGGFFLLLS